MDPIDPTTYPNWDDLLLTHPDYSIFHTSAWARVLHESYGYKPLYFASIKDESLETLIPMMEVKSLITGKRGVSLPFTDFCPIISPDKESFQNAIKHVKEYGRKAGWKYMEFRGGESCFNHEPASSVYYTHDLDLTQGEETILSMFRNSTRRNIKKAIKEQVDVRISNDPDSMKQFYKLNCITRKRHGLPPQPYRFFEKLNEHIVSNKQGAVFLGTHDGNAVAGMIFFHFGKKAMFKFGASEMQYQNLRANNIVMWEAIKWCLRKGCTTLSLGRTEPQNEGLLQFKRGWGPHEKKTEYHRYDVHLARFVGKHYQFKESYKLFKGFPAWGLNLFGRLFYKHVG